MLTTFLTRAEFGVTGVGRHCHACSGPGGRCRGPGDGGVGLDCGEGVTTCTLAINSESHVMCTDLDTMTSCPQMSLGAGREAAAPQGWG